jgi:hypothetical protein
MPKLQAKGAEHTGIAARSDRSFPAGFGNRVLPILCDNSQTLRVVHSRGAARGRDRRGRKGLRQCSRNGGPCLPSIRLGYAAIANFSRLDGLYDAALNSRLHTCGGLAVVEPRAPAALDVCDPATVHLLVEACRAAL